MQYNVLYSIPAPHDKCKQQSLILQVIKVIIHKLLFIGIMLGSPSPGTNYRLLQ